MLKPCGVIEACSPRGPKYSGKLIARAVELYRNGVKLGYIRWDELQSTLEKEFPSEFAQAGQDKPSPETVMDWVRKYPDAPERLKQLRVQQVDPGQLTLRMGFPYAGQLQPMPMLLNRGISGVDIHGVFGWLMALLLMTIMARCISSALAE